MTIDELLKATDDDDIYYILQKRYKHTKEGYDALEQTRFSEELLSQATSMIFNKEVQSYFEDDPMPNDRNIIKALQKRFDAKFSSSDGHLPKHEDFIPQLCTPDQRNLLSNGEANQSWVFKRNEFRTNS